MLFLWYLFLTLVIGCIVFLLTLVANEDIGIFFDSKKWSDNSITMPIALSLGYTLAFGFALCYWLYRFGVFIKETVERR